MVWTPPATPSAPDHTMCWEHTFASQKLLKAPSFHQQHGLGRMAFDHFVFFNEKEKYKGLEARRPRGIRERKKE